MTTAKASARANTRPAKDLLIVALFKFRRAIVAACQIGNKVPGAALLLQSGAYDADEYQVFYVVMPSGWTQVCVKGCKIASRCLHACSAHTLSPAAPMQQT
jgi:hypothetical protein